VFAGFGQGTPPLPGPLFVPSSRFGDCTLAVIIGFDVQRFSVPFVDHAGSLLLDAAAGRLRRSGLIFSVREVSVSLQILVAPSPL
jgi:hypothetical protein